ncbi:hypothetical protein HID58_030848 [Brassica napus]|uniref:Uncharacterized protein n=1 Tax=Brassica napus TaxID=3708 RepID=A0ABQ8CI21_BRANA|nr:hypothetical protein HID58_030848 [Brassica napus]
MAHKRRFSPALGVIQAHLLRPSAKQSPLLPPLAPTLSSFSSTCFLLAHAPTEETDPLRLTAFLQLEEDATLKCDDSQDEEASEE